MSLNEYLTKYGLTQTLLSRAIGISQGHLSQIMAGRVRVSPELASRIEAYTGGDVTIPDLRAIPHRPYVKTRHPIDSEPATADAEPTPSERDPEAEPVI